MRVQLELYASLMQHLPADADKHRTQVEVADDLTPYQLLDKFGVPREHAHLVLHNGVYLHPAEREASCLKEGDVIAVWPPVAGG